MKKLILGLTLLTSVAFGGKTWDFDLWRSTDHTVILTPPSATDTLVGRASTDNLTNKSISGSTNTLTNIPMSSATGTLAIAQGGTGQGSFAAGIIRSNGSALQSTTVNMTTEVQGTLGIANGGTGQSTANAGFNALSPMTTGGDIIYGGASGVATRLANGSNGQVLTSSGGTAAPTWTAVGVGSVTSVAATVPTFLSVAGSPITTNGTLAITLSGTALPVANGGTALTSGTSGGILGFTSAGTLASSGALTASQLVIGGGAGVTPSSLAAGSQYLPLVMGASAPGYLALALDQTASTSGTLAISKGGTGFGTATAAFNALHPLTTTGDMLYTSSGSTAARLAVGTANQVIKSVGGVPTWSNADAGGLNYISAASDGSTIGVWATFDDGSVAIPVDGTGGSPGITFAVSTDSTLHGTTNFLFTHDAADRKGEGFSYAFTIDPADKGKVLQGEFVYSIASGTFADDGFDWYIYDVTNSTVTQPAPFHLKNHALAAERFPFEFQTASNSTSYRLIGIVTTTTATAYTLRFDDFKVGPTAKLYGSPITDWVIYTPTGGWSGGGSTYTGMWRRNGDSMEIQAKVTVTSGPTGNLYFSLPAGYTIDTAKFPGTVAEGFSVGTAHGLAGGNWVQSQAAYRNTTSIEPLGLGGSSASNHTLNYHTSTSPFTTSSGDYVDIVASVPIVGWSSSVVMSSDANTNVISYYGTQTSEAVTANVTNITFTTTKDSHGAWATNIYTVKVPGDYFISGSLIPNGAMAPAVYKNGSLFQYWMNIIAGSPAGGGSTLLPNLIAGDTISLRSTQSITVTGASIGIFRLSGPAQIAASDSITMRATGTATGTLANSVNIMKLGTVTKDSIGGYSTSTGVYTVQSSGLYWVTGKYRVQGTTSGTSGANEISIYKNGAVYSYSNSRDEVTGLTGGKLLSVTSLVPCLTNDTLDIRSYTDRTSPTYNNGTGDNDFIVVRVGNY